MQIYKKRILGLIISSFVFSLGQQVSAQTLKEVVATAVHTHPEVMIVAEARNADKQTVAQAQAGYFPVIDLNAGYGREKADNFSSNFNTISLWRTDLGISARQPLFDGFATRSEIKRTRAKTNADSYRVHGAAEDQALSTVQAYLDVLRSQELVAIARHNLSKHEITYGMVNRLSQQGLGREADTEQSGGRVDLARANLKSAQNNLINAKINFQKVTGVIPQALEKVPAVSSDVLPRTEKEALERALANHPTLKSANTDIIQAKGQYETSKSKFYPRIDLVISALQSKNVGGAEGPDHDRLVELQMNYNIFQGGKDIARTRETAYQIQQAMEIRNRSEYQVTELTRLSWQAYESTQSRLPLLRAHQQSALSITGSYKRQFQLNKRTILDVLDSQNEYYSAEQDLLNEHYAFLLSQYRLLNAQGCLVEYLGVSLPREAHIPYAKM